MTRGLRVAALWVVLVALATSWLLWRPTAHAPVRARLTGALFAVRPGARQQVAESPDVAQVVVRLSDRGCVADRQGAPAGPVTFTVVNPGGTVVSELELSHGDRILGEREGVAAGTRRSFSLRLDAGTYALACPGTAAPATRFTVVGG